MSMHTHIHTQMHVLRCTSLARENSVRVFLNKIEMELAQENTTQSAFSARP